MKINERVKVILISYLIGIPFGIIFYLLRASGRSEIKGQRLVFNDSLILVYNHFFLLDPAFAPLLYFPRYSFNPFRLLLLSIATKESN